MEKNDAPQRQPETPLPVETALGRMKTLYGQGRYQEALDVCLEIARNHPSHAAAALSDAASVCIYLHRWQDAIQCGQTALAHGSNKLGLYDALAHAHAKLEQWEEARRYGLQALELRDRQVSGAPVMPWPEPAPLPPAPSAQTRARNLIAFSLFGSNPKYCDSAVMNVQEQPSVYPHWICRFYVDASVPQRVLDRLRSGGAQVVLVDGDAARWPGPMWRFLALDDPQAHRILFRDADSLISPREAGAVQEWIASGKRFHMMRDAGSHTELMLIRFHPPVHPMMRDAGSHTELMMAGLWGVVAGSLPPLAGLMQRFMSQPLESAHFADQYFLRQYVWPYARASLMQHDSVFGFMGGAPFPDGPRAKGVCVGDGPTKVTAPINRPDGTAMTWAVCRIEKLGNGQTREEPVCSFAAAVHNGAVTMYVPSRYVQMIQQGTARLNLDDVNSAA
jgi:hypothetical protein